MNRDRIRWLPVGLALAFLAIASAQAVEAQVKKYQEITYPPLPRFEIPAPAVFTLKNGPKVLLIEDHELPLLTVTARIRTGSFYEPADKVGLASIMGSVQRTGGTARMSGDEIDDFLADRAASVETSVGDDSGTASMNCLKQDFDEVFKVFVDVLRAPAFSQEKLDLAKVQANTEISRRNDNINAIIGRELGRLVYGPGSPIARLREYATIAAITRDDLVAWHKQYYQPANIYIGVVGDFDSKEMRKKIEAALGNWPRGSAFVPQPPPFRKDPNPGVFFIEKSDVTQANIAFAHIGIERKNPDYFAVQVLNEVLSGGFASRLFSNVRSKKGLAYNVYGGLGASFTNPGLFTVGLQTKSATMTEAVEALKQEIEGIIDNPPDDAELTKAKQSILNSFVFNYDSKAKILGQQMTYAFYGLPADYLEQYRGNIEKVNREDVARVAKKYLHPEQLTLLVVGKSADFGNPVESLGKVTKLDITIPGPPGAPRAAASEATGQEGMALFTRMATALLGDQAGSLKGFRSSSSVKVFAPTGEMQVKQREWLVFPNKLRQDQEYPAFGTFTLLLVGKDGWWVTPSGTRTPPESMKAEMVRQVATNLYLLASRMGEASLKVVGAGTENVGGSACSVLQVDYGDGTLRLCVDPKSSLPVKESYRGSVAGGAPASIERFFSDWRAVDGVMVPFSTRLKGDGEDVTTSTVDEFEINPKVDESTFQKPPA